MDHFSLPLVLFTVRAIHYISEDMISHRTLSLVKEKSGLIQTITARIMGVQT